MSIANGKEIKSKLLRAAIEESIRNNEENIADQFFGAARDFGIDISRKSIASELSNKYDELDNAYTNLNKKLYMSRIWRRTGRVFYWLIIAVEMVYIFLLQSQF